MPPETQSDPSRAENRPLDAAYKQLFRHSDMVKDLICGFVAPHLCHLLDFPTLEQFPAEFVRKDRKRRYSDMIWRVRFRDSGRWLFLVLEFQSTVDKSMALRLLEYVSLLCEAIDQGRKYLGPNGELPEIWPIVIYCGEPEWTALCSLDPLVWGDEAAVGEGERPGRVLLKYALVDHHRLAKALGDLPPRNCESFLIRLEHLPKRRESAEQLCRDIEERLFELDLEDHHRQNLGRIFSDWLVEYLDMGHLIDRSRHPQDQLRQIAKNVTSWGPRHWAREWLAEGLTKGRKEGLTEGREEGLTEGREQLLDEIRKNLYDQIELRFDPKTVKQLIRSLKPISDVDVLMKVCRQIDRGATGADLLQCLDGRK